MWVFTFIQKMINIINYDFFLCILQKKIVRYIFSLFIPYRHLESTNFF